jgi:hypothetical protein
VLKGLSFERWAPKVVIAAYLFEGSEYQKFLSEAGYELWRCVAPNEVYVETADTSFTRHSLNEV